MDGSALSRVLFSRDRLVRARCRLSGPRAIQPTASERPGYMSLHNDNLTERNRALTNDVAVLETIARLALESARNRVTYFARLAAIARYGTRVQCPDIDHAVLLASIEQLSEQYEREARTQEDGLRATYALHALHKGDEWARLSSAMH